MEIQFDNEPKRGSRPATKMYAPTRENVAYEYTPVTRVSDQPVFEDGDAPRAAKRKRTETEIKLASRIGIVMCAFAFAGMVLFVLSGYERISRAYADINTLNSEIDERELRIKALEASIECAVTISDAQEAAEALGMRYPEQSQYVPAGSAVPLSGTAPTASSGTGTGGETTPPDGTAQPGGNG